MILQVAFIYFAAVTVFSALMVITRKNPVHCALYMLAVFTHVAGLFVLLDAEFVAAVQVLVYAGAILVLFLFVIMLFRGDGMKDKARFVSGWPIVAPIAIALMGLLMSILMHSGFSGAQGSYTIEAVRSAQEKHDGDARDHEHVRVFRHKEIRKTHTGILDMEAGDQFVLRLREVERRAVRLGYPGNHVNDERHGLVDYIPDMFLAARYVYQ